MTDLAELVAELRAPATDIAERNDLRARAADVIEGMREALTAFIEWADSPRPSDCPYCYVPESWEPTTEHLPECPFVKARAALALPDSKPDKGGA